MRVGARSQTPYGLTRLLSAIFKIIVVETTLIIHGSSIISTFIILTRHHESRYKSTSYDYINHKGSWVLTQGYVMYRS